MAETRTERKKFVTYEQACELYCMGITKLKDVAREAGAMYKLNRKVLINIDKMDAYIETFKVDGR